MHEDGAMVAACVCAFNHLSTFGEPFEQSSEHEHLCRVTLEAASAALRGNEPFATTGYPPPNLSGSWLHLLQWLAHSSCRLESSIGLIAWQAFSFSPTCHQRRGGMTCRILHARAFWDGSANVLTLTVQCQQTSTRRSSLQINKTYDMMLPCPASTSLGRRNSST